MEWTGERCLPNMHGDWVAEHVHRYALAACLCAGKDVLDVASGEGYGSAKLASTAKSVIGVDIDSNAVEHANSTYNLPNLEYRQGSATDLATAGLADDSFDVVVSFETIEHLHDHQAMLDELCRVLRPSGILLISSPDKLEYTDIPDHQNEYHVHELYKAEFEEHIKSRFSHCRMYGQRMGFSSLIIAEEAAGFTTFTSEEQNEHLAHAVYNIVLAANHPLPSLPHSIFLHSIPHCDYVAGLKTEHDEVLRSKNEQLSDFQSQLSTCVQQIELMKQSRSWRITAPLRKVGKILREIKGSAVTPKKKCNFFFDTCKGYTLGKCKKIIRKAKSVKILRKIGEKLIFKSNGQIRPVCKRLYTFLKIASGPVYSEAAQTPKDQTYFPSIAQSYAPRLTVVAMAKNESARVHDIMRHFCALFDRIVLIDHLSEDDTAQIAMSYNGIGNTEVIVFRGLDKGYYQSEYMSACANALIAEKATDWLFFLDFDEFLPFKNATEFHQALVGLSSEAVINMPWYNLALRELDPKTLQGADVILGDDASEYVKIALNVRALSQTTVQITQGNHSVVLPDSDTQYYGKLAFGLFHIPILGSQNLKAKILQGVEALKASVGKSSILGFHWTEMSQSIETLTENPELMREVALQYSQPLQDIIVAVANKKFTKNTRRITLKFAQIEPVNDLLVNLPEVKAFTLENISDVLTESFTTSQKTCIKKLPSPNYSALPMHTKLVEPDNTSAIRALLAATMEIQDTPYRSQLGHVPCLFALLEVCRPYRYVELGAAEGASFFAACQHIWANGNYGEAIAVDLWTANNGEPEEKSFSDFKSTLEKSFAKTGKLIRGQSADACSVFADDSVDFLHIKGTHTFNEVKAIYDLWRTKMTDDSIVVFQNTNKYHGKFGVWQLFDLIRNEAAESFQFYHTHGLGILAFGTKETNPAIELLEYFNAYPKETELYFSNITKMLSLPEGF